MGSPCLFLHCVLVILSAFFLVACEMFETLKAVKNSYFVTTTKNLTKTLGLCVCLGYIF